MSKEKQLLKNTLIVSIGKIATQLITFLLLPLYTNMLTTEEYGVVDLLNSVVIFILPVLTLQIENATFRFLVDARGNNNEKKKIITNNIFTLIIQIAISLMLYLCIQKYITSEYKIFLILNIFAHMLSAEMLQITRGLGNNKNYTVTSFIISFVNVLLNVILIVGFNIGAYGLLIGNFASNCIGALYVFISQKLYLYIKIKSFDKNLLKQMLIYSIPLIPNALSWWVLNVSDRMLVSYFLGLGINGIYTAANKFSSAYVMIYNIFNLTWTESVSININSKDNEIYINKILNTSFILFSTFCLGILAFMPFIFNILIGKNFSDAYFQIPILMVGSLVFVLISLISAIYVAKKLSTKLAKTTLVAAIINIVFNVILIKYIGLYAASLSTLIAYLVTFIHRYLDIKKYINIKLDYNKILFVLVCFIVVIFSYYLNNMYINILSLLFVILISIFLNKKNIKFIVSIMKNKVGGKFGK